MANVRRLARSIQVDVSADGGTTWLSCPERIDNAPQITPNKVDATSTDTDGNTSAEVTLQSGVLTLKYNSLINGGTPDAAHELIEGTVGQFGDSVRLTVRWYDTDGGSRGGQALAIVEVSYSKTGVADLREVTATFTLDGTITKLTQSQIDTLVAALTGPVAPVVTSATPSGVAAGGLVKITGQNFKNQAISSVKFGAVTATVTTVDSDSVIWAVMPAGTAGSAAVTVTNATGTSNALPYTRGA